MKNKKLDNILDLFPEELGLVQNPKDPLHILLEYAAHIIDDVDVDLTNKLNNLFIDYMDPVLPSGCYYDDTAFYEEDDTKDFFIGGGSKLNGTAEIVETEEEFLENRITGLGVYPSGVLVSGYYPDGIIPDESIDLPADFFPSGSAPSGIIGLSYGFDWEDPYWYITGGDNVIYTGDNEFIVQSTKNVSLSIQSYSEVGFDEYLEFKVKDVVFYKDWYINQSISFTIPGFITDVDISYTQDDLETDLEATDYTLTQQIDGTTDVVVDALGVVDDLVKLNILYKHKYANIANTSISGLKVMDIYNINDATGEGTELGRSELDEFGDLVISDFVLVGTRVYMNNVNKYNSRYIIEYSYNNDSEATYLSQREKRHGLGLKVAPRYEL